MHSADRKGLKAESLPAFGGARGDQGSKVKGNRKEKRGAVPLANSTNSTNSTNKTNKTQLTKRSKRSKFIP
jgi:hypothetical protein